MWSKLKAGYFSVGSWNNLLPWARVEGSKGT